MAQVGGGIDGQCHAKQWTAQVLQEVGVKATAAASSGLTVAAELALLYHCRCCVPVWTAQVLLEMGVKATAAA
jgi:hypothetical protein